MAYRLFLALFMTNNLLHPDEYWQAIEVAYNYVYGGVQLSWEWQPTYRMRNTLYPFYLIIPLQILKTLGLDYGIAVRCCPYIAHCILVIISDWYLWKVGIKIFGKNTARITLIFYLFNRVYNEILIRCFGNSIESIANIIAFNYYLNQKDKFDGNTMKMTALISISFMIRNTSPVGWIPLLLLKILYEKSLLPFIKAGFVIAIPVILFSILLDSIYFGEFTVTSYNFLRANILEGLSKYFGTDEFHMYIIAFIPFYFTSAVPAFYVGLVSYTRDYRSKRLIPYLFYMIVFYVLIFSMIPHKEYRFMQPIIPFCFLIIGYFYNGCMKKYGKIVRIMIYLYIIEQALVSYIITKFHFSQWKVMKYLADEALAPHSIYSMQNVDLPYYTWSHRKHYGEFGKNRTRLTLFKKDPPFQLIKDGLPFPIIHDHDYNGCLNMLDQISQEIIRPEYVIAFKFETGGHFYCFEACIKKFESLGFYEKIKEFDAHLVGYRFRFGYYYKTRILYKLKDIYQPF
ncbi:UNKNOWN [Stylonychia lemnae]|uniref:Mannosyltransferase n=1 Tax=Stylonychia lemnae TaxID=5949 RepID=A0A078AC06_STYLE|nr:UNKNOWN [Stylonychia lemnae]|eukprot:CDW78313.1 UNKNOWN [Stylonychia lemnae]